MTLLLCQILFFLDEIIAYWLIGKKKWYGWLVKLLGLAPLTVINIIANLPVFHLLNLFFLVVFVRNMQDWKRYAPSMRL